MKQSMIYLGVLAALACNASYADKDNRDKHDNHHQHDKGHHEQKKIVAIDFIGMDAPTTAEQRASVYTDAKVKIRYKNGRSAMQPLEYKQLFATTEEINGVVAGGLYDVDGSPLMDTSVSGNFTQYVSDTPDANSLMKIDHVKAKALGVKGNPLFMVTHYEYVTANNSGASEYGKLPMAMSLTTLDQNKQTGELSLVDYSNIDMAGIKGLWIPCAGSLSPWNTHT